MAFRKRTLEQELQEALLRGSMRKAFGRFDLLMLGLGITVASGYAQLSGYAAQQYAGPAVIVSYVFSGVAAVVAACCFAELSQEFPVAGGAFSYVMATFGELAAFITLGGLLLEYVLGMAAVARGFSRQLARLCNLDPQQFVINIGGEYSPHFIDIMAAGIVLLMSVLLSLGVRESAWFISGVTVFKLVLLVVVSIVGYVQGTWDNAEPFIDPNFGADGIFLGAAVLYFTYVGFDAISNAAEETRDVKHMPWAIVGTPLAAMVMYVMLAFALVMITYPNPRAALPWNPSLGRDGPGQGLPFGPYPGVSFPALDTCNGPQLTFTIAFVELQGLKYMQYILAVATLMGIVTALTVGLFSASRIVMSAARDWLLPPFLAIISPRTQTPLVAQMVLGVIIAALAMTIETEMATAMVSFGTLVALWLVCNAQMFRRYWPGVQMRFTQYGGVEAVAGGELDSWALGRRLSVQARKLLFGVHMLAVNGISIALGAYYAASTDPMSNVKSAKDWAHFVDNNYPGGAKNCTPIVNYALLADLDGCPQEVLDTDPESCTRLGHTSLACLYIVLAWFLVTLSFQACCPLEHKPAGWHVPWWMMPWLPSTAIGMCIFCVGALPSNEYWKIGVFFGGLLVFFLLFSLPMSYIKHNRVDFVNAEELKVVELRFINGEWRPARIAEMHPAASVTTSIGVHASQALNGSAASLGVRPSYPYSMELKGSGVLPAAAVARAVTDSAAGSIAGRLHSGRSPRSPTAAPTAERLSRMSPAQQQRSRRSLQLPPLPPTQEEGPTK
ncbi:hypothetical protein COHA_006002 [Chlorella ohadii]|uniref:Cationic amino acid transporter n=1 Tax=Chlorella ohadii TaxID=2649997 RepID=A0AAD5DLX3_9CHLO|nr:hypothetical protein COHA_006002 [Chlorella ohadii]